MEITKYSSQKFLLDKYNNCWNVIGKISKQLLKFSCCWHTIIILMGASNRPYEITYFSKILLQAKWITTGTLGLIQ